LDGVEALQPAALQHALTDEHPGVRRHAVRLSEPFLRDSPELASAVLGLVPDSDMMVRYQLALSLGEWDDPRAGRALGALAVTGMNDVWMRAAILSSSVAHPEVALKAVLTSPSTASGRGEMIGGLITTAIASENSDLLERVVAAVAVSDAGEVEAWQVTALANLVEALERRNEALRQFAGQVDLPEGYVQQGIEAIIACARRLVRDDSAKLEMREAAVRLLGARTVGTAEDREQIAAILDGVPAQLQRAALETLRRNADAQIPALLLEGWARRSPSLRSMTIDVLLSRDEWIQPMLAAVDEGLVSGAEISATNRDRLLKHKNAAIRDRAQAALEAFRPEGRREVMAAYREVAELTGNAARGAEIFEASCAACHTFRGAGHAIGPDVLLFGNKSVDDFLEAILDPNAVLEPRFINYSVETKDGRRLSGIVGEETANSLTILQAGGLRESLLRSDILEIQASNFSMMPEGLEQNISRREMADLIAYLRSGAPRPFGSASAEQAQAAREAFLSGKANGVARVTASSETLHYPGWLGQLPMPHCRQTDGTSRVAWETEPVSQDLDPETMYGFRLPIGMGHHAQPRGHFSLRLNGTPVLNFDVVLNDHAWARPDGSIRLEYEVKENNTEDSNGILTIKARGSLLEAGRPARFEVVGSPSNSLRWFGIYLFPDGAVAAVSGNAPEPLARQILDDSKPAPAREAIIRDHPDRSVEFLKEMISDLPVGTPEEYRRIPWIWRLTIAAGRRNDADELRRMLEISTPQLDAPLTDWEAVVIGGGIINGITMAGDWPGQRILDIIGDDEDLLRRWNRALDLSAGMADDETVPYGTRYDALRMIALQPWEKRGAQLVRYIGREVHPELQQGAVSGLADMPSPRATRVLIERLGGLTEHNRNFALDGLIRSPDRIEALLDAIAAGQISKDTLGESRIQRLMQHGDAALRQRARDRLSSD
jgi:putative heme-binding domain-containing protein